MGHYALRSHFASLTKPSFLVLYSIDVSDLSYGWNGCILRIEGHPFPFKEFMSIIVELRETYTTTLRITRRRVSLWDSNTKSRLRRIKLIEIKLEAKFEWTTKPSLLQLFAHLEQVETVHLAHIKDDVNFDSFLKTLETRLDRMKALRLTGYRADTIVPIYNHFPPIEALYAEDTKPTHLTGFDGQIARSVVCISSRTPDSRLDAIDDEDNNQYKDRILANAGSLQQVYIKTDVKERFQFFVDNGIGGLGHALLIEAIVIE